MIRADLKAQAKASMSWARPHPAWVTLVYLLITGGLNFVVQLDNNTASSLIQGNYNSLVDLVPYSAGIMILIFLFNLLVTVIQAGYLKYCIQVSRNQPAGFGTLFDLLNRLFRYIGLSLVMALIVTGVSMACMIPFILLVFVSEAFAFLAVLVFVPAIYLTLAYSQAMYFAVDDLNMGIIECLRESRAIMRGRKGEYFVLQLSFIPWVFLIAFTVGLASLWVTPYMNVTNANYFNHLVQYRPPQEAAEDEAAPSDDGPPDDWYNQ